MVHSQFMRIVTIAGGDNCSERRFIRACHTLLKQEAKGRGCRVSRHEWIRGGLRLLWDDRELLRTQSLHWGQGSRSVASFVDYEDWVIDTLCEQMQITRSDAQGLAVLYTEAVTDGFEQGVGITRMASLIAAGSVPMTELGRGAMRPTDAKS